MADRVKKVSYAYVTVPDRAGHGVRILEDLKDAGVNLIALHAFPIQNGRSQIDLFAKDAAKLRRVARQKNWKLSPIKKGFLVQGDDKIGAVHRHFERLAEVMVNITATDAIAAGKDRYAMLLWVKPKDYGRAARALKAK